MAKSHFNIQFQCFNLKKTLRLKSYPLLDNHSGGDIIYLPGQQSVGHELPGSDGYTLFHHFAPETKQTKISVTRDHRIDRKTAGRQFNKQQV